MRRLVPDFIIRNFSDGLEEGSFKAVVLFADISGFSSMTESLMKHGQHGAEVLAILMRQVLEPMIASVYRHHGFVSTIAGDAITAIFPIGDQELSVIEHALAAAFEMRAHRRSHSDYKSEYGLFYIAARIGLAVGDIEWGIITTNDRDRAAYFFRGSGIERCGDVEKKGKAGEIVADERISAAVGSTTIQHALEGCSRVERALKDFPEGTAIEESSIPLDLMTPFFPGRLVQQTLDGEFRQVVNVFINLPTTRTIRQLKVFMKLIFKFQERFGGLLNRLDFGDKGAHMLLFWGAPHTHENDIDRALSFLLALQEETSIPFHAGVTYRISHAGFIGSPLREEYTCYGKGVNLAARFMVAAPRGSIWVDRPVADRAENQHEIEFLEERVFKGFSDPQPIFLLKERKGLVSSMFQGEIVGRQAELDELAGFLQPPGNNRFCGAVLVRGEAGIGKSRLIYEVEKRIGLESRRVLWARCASRQFVQEAFFPLRYWLKQYFNILDFQGEARNKRNFNLKLDNLIASFEDPAIIEELDRTRSFLGALVGLFWSDSLYAEMEPQQRFENTLAGLTALLRAESRLQPVILLIEDVHWLDADTQTFLSHLFASAERDPLPLAIVTTARPTEEADVLGRDVPFAVIDLGTFRETEVAQLSCQILGKPPGPRLMNLLQRAGGNPFFVEQVLRLLREIGSLEEEPDAFEMREGERVPLPTDVRSVLVARLDGLEPDQKILVQFASVLGREFDLHILKKMIDQDIDLVRYLRKCQRQSILSHLDKDRYLFNHALMQDAAYRMQTRAQRARLHAAAVAAFEQQYADDLDTRFGSLAFHSEKAGDLLRAFKFYQQAAERAVQNYANQEAILHFDGALRLGEKVAAPLQTIAGLYCSRGGVYELVGNFEKARADYEHSQATALESNSPAIAWQNLINLGKLWASRDYEKTRSYFQKALEFAGQVGDPLRLGTSLNWMGNWHSNNENPEEAIAFHREALEIFENMGRAMEVAHTLDFLGIAYILGADLEASRKAYDQAVQIYRKQEAPQGLINSLMGRGALGYAPLLDTVVSSAHPQQSFDDFQEAIEISREIGSPLLENGPYWLLGLQYLIRGDYAKAHHVIQKGVQLSKDLQHKEWLVSNLYASGVFYLEAFSFDLAIDVLEEALALTIELQSKIWHHWVTAVLGKAYCRYGEPDKARQCLKSAIGPESPMNTAGRRQCWMALAELAFLNGNPDQARSIVERLIESAAGLGPQGVVTGLWLLKAKTLFCQGQPGEALDILQQAETHARNADEAVLLWRVCGMQARVLNQFGNNTAAEQSADQARRMVQKMSETIQDHELRQRFLDGAMQEAA